MAVKHRRVERNRLKRRLRGETEEEARQRELEIKSVSRSLVFSRSQRSIGPLLDALIQDVRTLMLPYTAKNVSVHRRTPVRRLLEIARSIYVSHFVVFSLAQRGPKMKLMRIPLGPTIYFSIESYSLIRDVRSFYQRVGLQFDSRPHLTRNPCVVLTSGFSSVPWHEITRTTLEHAFPDVSADKVDIAFDLTRVAMFRMREDGLIDFRHYSVNLASEEDVMTVDDSVSDSDSDEDGPVVRRVGLTELGPRMTLRVEKIVDGLFDGEVIYHAWENRTEGQVQSLRQLHNSRRRDRAERRKVQEENVERKLEKKRAKKLRKKRKREVVSSHDDAVPTPKRRKLQ